MKVVLLAGGFGTRLSEVTDVRPKPMVEIGGQPIIWHIMKIYSHYGFHDFVICLGYKGYVLKEYFTNYMLHQAAEVTVDVREKHIEMNSTKAEPWRVTLVETGLNTMTGGRIKRIQPYVGNEDFFMTYGDGVSNVNIRTLLEYHRERQKLATLTAIQPPGRFGALDLDDHNTIHKFMEKPKGDKAWINGGFFVLSPKIFDYITEGDSTVFEQKPLENLASDGQLTAYKHDGFWQSMDTLRDRYTLENLWSTTAPWKQWSE
ncbi:MAG: glucose-1-phosphate cytidylyltransferase [Myxococcales bacterium]|nr:glucose-1-phosphate cytidylyltransferase [Myxococcales bacterium]